MIHIIVLLALLTISRTNGAIWQEPEETCMQFKISTYVPDCSISQIARYTDEGIACIGEECKQQLKNQYANGKAQVKIFFDAAELGRDATSLKENVLRSATYTMVLGSEILHEAIIKQNNLIEAAIKKIRSKSNGTIYEKANAIRAQKLKSVSEAASDNIYISTLSELMLIVTMEDNITTQLRHLFDAKNTTAEIDAARKVYEIKVFEINEKIQNKINEYLQPIHETLYMFIN